MSAVEDTYTIENDTSLITHGVHMEPFMPVGCITAEATLLTWRYPRLRKVQPEDDNFAIGRSLPTKHNELRHL